MCLMVVADRPVLRTQASKDEILALMQMVGVANRMRLDSFVSVLATCTLGAVPFDSSVWDSYAN